MAASSSSSSLESSESATSSSVSVSSSKPWSQSVRLERAQFIHRELLSLNQLNGLEPALLSLIVDFSLPPFLCICLHGYYVQKADEDSYNTVRFFRVPSEKNAENSQPKINVRVGMISDEKQSFDQILPFIQKWFKVQEDDASFSMTKEGKIEFRSILRTPKFEVDYFGFLSDGEIRLGTMGKSGESTRIENYKFIPIPELEEDVVWP